MSVSHVGEDLDDFAAIYEPLSKDGAFVLYKPRAIEDLQEPYKADRLNFRYTQVAPTRLRRLVSVARSRDLLKQKAGKPLEPLELEPPLVEGKKDDEILQTLRGGVPSLGVEVDTEAEDSEVMDEVSVGHTDHGRPCFLERAEEAPLDGCHHLFVRSKGPLHSPDEPPDFLQLPEPIKQRTAGAARVAAAARAWAAASGAPPPPVGTVIGIGQAAGSEVPMMVMMNQDMPATARGNPTDRTPAQIMAELRQQGQDAAARAADQSRAVEPREAVAGSAVLALRRMRNRMSSLAEGLPWSSSPRDPNRPSRPRSLMPSFSRTAASSSGAASSNQGADSVAMAPQGDLNSGRLPADPGGAASEPQYQPLVPTPPTRPKPNGRGSFFSRNWPRMNLMGSLGWSGSASSSSRGDQSRPGTQATGRQQDPTPSSAQGSP